MPGIHASLGASSASRWMKCPGSVRLSVGLPDTENEYAYEGTCAHYLGELCLNNGKMPSDYVGQTLELPESDQYDSFPAEFEVTKEMGEYIDGYVSYCNEIGQGIRFIEERLDYSKWVEGGFGTGDFMHFNVEDGILDVVDLKYGKTAVEVEGNPQLMLYALGGYDMVSVFDTVREIRMTIYQPRIDNISTTSIITRDLLKFGEEARKAAEATQKEDAPLVAGLEQCKWCRVKDRPEGCKAYMEFGAEMAMSVFGDADCDQDKTNAIKHVGEDVIVEVVRNKKFIDDFVKYCFSVAESHALAGSPLPGTKLVAGRRSKSYTEDDDYVLKRMKALRDTKAKDCVTTKVLTPAQAIKMLGPDHHFIKKFVTVNEGKPTVVSDDDKRPAIDLAAEAAERFENS